MFTETIQSPSTLNAIGRPVIWEGDLKVQNDLTSYAARTALRACPREAKGHRCFNCRPLLMAASSSVATHYVTFQMRPAGAQ